MQQLGPVLPHELLGQPLRRLGVGQRHEGVVELLVGHAAAIQAPVQPLMAVDIDLHSQRQPGLHLDVDQAEVGVEEVIVHDGATAVVGLQAGTPLALGDAERPAGFQGGEGTDQAGGDAIALGDLAGQVVLARARGQVLKGAAGLVGQLTGMLLETVGLLGAKVLKSLRRMPCLLRKPSRARGWENGR